MIENYIAELLETNNRVIIPDLGAFMVKVEAGKKIITFNDFLKYNDGLLNNYIATKESITKDEAFKKIKEEVKKIHESLKSGQSIAFGKIGVLKKDERGGIQIVTKEDASKTEPVKAVDTSAQKNEEKNTIAPLKIDEGAKVSQPNSGNKEQEKQPASSNPAIGQKNNPTRQTTVKPGTPPPPPVAKKTPANNEGGGSSSTIIIVVAIVVILGVAGALIYLNYDKWFGSEEQEQLVETVIITEMTEEPIVEDIVEEPQPVVEPTPVYPPGTKKYYVVAGSFMNEANAHKFVEKLKIEGYNPEIFMKSGDFWRVSYNSYYERSEAFAELERLKREGKEVWIKKY